MSKSSLKSSEEAYMAKHTEQARARSAEAKGSAVQAYKHQSMWRDMRHGQGQQRTVIRRQISSAVSENMESRASRRRHSHSGGSGHTQILSVWVPGSTMSTCTSFLEVPTLIASTASLPWPVCVVTEAAGAWGDPQLLDLPRREPGGLPEQENPTCPLPAFCLKKNFSQRLSVIRILGKCRKENSQARQNNSSLDILNKVKDLKVLLKSWS